MIFLPPPLRCFAKSPSGPWTPRPGRPLPDLLAALADADALVVRSATKVTRDVIAAAPTLRVIARAGTGVDNVDLDAASQRGIIVMNAPGANSISVAELVLAQLLALARHLPAADAAMKTRKWEKKKFAGIELRGKTLGIVGLGRIGQEVAARARSFEMQIVAHDPFISAGLAAQLGARLATLDEVCAEADFLTLHLPVTPQTKHLFNAERLARCKKGIRICNTARGELIDTPALVEALRQRPGRRRRDRCVRAGAAGGLDARGAAERRRDPTYRGVNRRSTGTGGRRDRGGRSRLPARRHHPKRGELSVAVARRVPAAAAVGHRRRATGVDGRADGRGADLDRSACGTTASWRRGRTDLLASAVLVGLFRRMLSGGVSAVNAKAVAAERGIEVIESHSSRVRNFTSLLSVKLHTSDGERWVEGTLVEHSGPRLVLVDGVPVEAPLEGTQIVIKNNDQPGVIGAVGTVLGRHKVNIANFALGRSAGGAIGVVSVDEADRVTPAVMTELSAIPAVRSAQVVTLD